MALTDNVPAGSIRFNTDSAKMEIYNGDKWWEIDSTSPEAQTGGTRGLMAGGANPGYSDVIDYINISTTGDAIDFGNLLNAQYMLSGCASRTRGLFHGFQGSPNTRDNVIEYVTISTTGNALEFGEVAVARRWGAGMASSTRALLCGGYSGAYINTIDYIEISTGGDAVDFGDLVAEVGGLTSNSNCHGGLG